MSRLDALWSAWSHAALGGSLVLAVGAGALLAVRTPARRARLVALTALACLAVPLLGALPGLPRWSIATRPGRPASASPAPARVEAAPAGPALGAPGRPGRVAGAVDPPGLGMVEAARSAVGARPPADATRPIDRRGSIVLAWAGVVAVLMGWWGLGLLALSRVVRGASPASPALVGRFRGLVGPAGRSTRLLVSARIALPVTFTGRRPVILLPAALAGAAPEVDLALLHEWSHVERRDFRNWTLVSLVATLWWFCPLGWLLRRELRLGQDLLADDRAARLGSAVDLAALLIRLARSRRDPSRVPVPLPAPGIHARRSDLSRRVAMLVADRPPLPTRCRPAWTGSAVALMALAAALASGLRLDAAPQDPPPSVPAPPRPDPAKAEAPKAGHEWSGTIIDEKTNLPIAGAHVRVNLQNSRDPVTGRFAQIRDIESVTPADGTYRFTLSDAEQDERHLYVTLFVKHPDYVRYFGGYSFSMTLKNIGLGERPFFERLKLAPAVAVSGRLLTPDGAPAAGVKVNAYSTPAATGMDFDRGKWSDTRTDAAGRFRLPLHPTGQAVLWLLPVDLEPVTVPLRDDKRGDLGTFRLNPGIRIRGRVLDEAGRPVGGAYVLASRRQDPQWNKESGIPRGVADNIQRTVLTADDGTFTMTPLPPGVVTITPSERWWDPATRDDAVDLPNRPLPAVFVTQKLTLEAGREPEPLTIRAVPSVTIHAQTYDSKGVKRGGSETWLSGELNGERWSTQAEPSRDGSYTMRAPKGLAKAMFDLMTNEHGAMAWRPTRDAPLERNRTVRLGTLDRDVDGIEIVRFDAPVIVTRAVDPAGKTIARPKVTVNYTEPKQPGQGGSFRIGPDHHSDVNLEGPQEDGRVRTSQLQPDREVEVTAEAPGFAPSRRKLTLPEGKTEELTLTLQPK